MADAQSIISDARGFASDSLRSALPLIVNATGAINSLFKNQINVGTKAPVVVKPPADTSLSINFPEFQLAVLKPESPPPDATGFLADPTIDFGEAPVKTAVNPGFITPSLPAQLRAFSAAPPTISTNFVFPEPPAQLKNLQLAAPVINDRTAPTAPRVVLPGFDVNRPDTLPAPPTDYKSQFESSYRGIGPTMRAALNDEVKGFIEKYNPEFAAQMSRLEVKLDAYIKGGTALTPAVEDAIYSRATRKVDAEYRRTLDAANETAAKRGFSMPDGALFSTMRQARQDGANNATLAATEIAVKQAELEQANIQFAITTSTGLRTSILNASLSFHSNLVQINGQAVDYAKSVLSAMIEVYNTLVKAYSAQLDAYKAEASVYEARVRGTLALVEVYKAEISAFTALTEADVSKVKVYQSQIDALNSLANMYRTQVESVASKASLEKLKLELFGAQVEAFRSEASAKTSEYQSYSAAVAGQEGKLRAYGEEVRAYGTEVEAFRAQVNAKTAAVQSAISVNEGITRRYLGSVEAYRALTAGKATVISSQVESQKNQLLAVQAKFNAQEATARYGLEYYKTQAMINLETLKLDATTKVENSKIALSQLKSISDVSISGAQVYSGLANAALSGINTLVSQSLTE